MKKLLFVYLFLTTIPQAHSASAEAPLQENPCTIKFTDPSEKLKIIRYLALLSIRTRLFLEKQQEKLNLAKKQNNLDLALKRHSLYPFFLEKKNTIDAILRTFNIGSPEPLIVPTEILAMGLSKERIQILIEREKALDVLNEIAQINKAIEQIAITP